MDKRNKRGYFGDFGGLFVPETLMPALEELERAYKEIKTNAGFWEEFHALGRYYIGRPTPLYHARRLSEHSGGAQILLKREDLCHTGAHKINNALGQGLLARNMGKRRVVAETGAGQHGVATAAACALLDLECVVFMGSVDIERQSPNVQRMKLMGAEVRSVEAGSATLKEAISEALRDWVTHVDHTYYLLGSVVGPHPYPTLVRDFQAVIGREAREQLMSTYGRLPDRIVACVGGGSNAMGIFYPFLDDPVSLIGVEAAGKGLGADTHSATLVKGRPGVLHGTRSYLLQDAHGQIDPTHSIAPGLDYPGVGPEHSFLRDTGRVKYVAVDDAGALEGFQLLSRLEGILPALEPSHAIFHALFVAHDLPKEGLVLVNLSGRGDKDIGIVVEHLRP